MKKRQGYLFEEGLIKMIKELKEKLHANSDTAILIQAVNKMYEDVFSKQKDHEKKKDILPG